MASVAVLPFSIASSDRDVTYLSPGLTAGLIDSLSPYPRLRVATRDAKGLAILTVTKAGFLLSGRGGTGVVVARTENGWSGPSAIGTGGLGLGFQAGVQVSEYVIILNTQEAINSFAKGNNVTLGGNLSAAIGPLGRSAEAAIAPQAAIYTYSPSQGIFAGVSLEGTVIATRYQQNEEYYGKAAFPSDIFSGDLKPPAGAQKLLDVLSKY